ncbi:MAG: hypothetical protein WC389_18010 [Lutibacter sp.]|jgi:hypothetical protein
MSKDYEPYGPEWETQMMKHNKKELIRLLKMSFQTEAATKLCPICKEVIDENLFCYKCRNA